MYVCEKERGKRTGDGLERGEYGRVHGELANAVKKVDDLGPQVAVVKAVYQITNTVVSDDVIHLIGGRRK